MAFVGMVLFVGMVALDRMSLALDRMSFARMSLALGRMAFAKPRPERTVGPRGLSKPASRKFKGSYSPSLSDCQGRDSSLCA